MEYTKVTVIDGTEFGFYRDMAHFKVVVFDNKKKAQRTLSYESGEIEARKSINHFINTGFSLFGVEFSPRNIEVEVTDIDKIKSLFDALKIEYEDLSDGVIRTIRLTPDSLNVDGIENIQTDFDFSHDGKFREVGIWKQH